MDPPPSSGAGSGTSGTYTSEAAETLRFEEEIHSLMRDNLIDQGIESPPRSGGDNSFTALLGLAPNQAVELLHGPEPAAAGPEMWREKALRVPLDCSPTFPTNAALVERAARFSVYAAEEDDACGISPANPKVEPEEYSDLPMYAIHGEETQKKRKEGDRIKVKNGGAKKTKSAEEDTGGEKLPYVHVRARRGQATDSHSLAERARREKINARMKLLQELVPGCSKITGTALVLDEIINHVQFLQRRVEILSMSLAAVNPRIDYGGLDSFFSAAECEPVTAMMNGRSRMSLEQQISWLEGPAMAGNGVRRQPAWQVDAVQQQEGQMWERRDDATPRAFIAPTAGSLFSYDSAISVSLPNQLKTEL